jgi:CRISPR-associated protein Csm3
MADKERSITLQGRAFLKGQIKLVTGLHIGAARTALAIGGLDNPVVRDPLTERPYIPGSSLKGKIRSLLEKQYGLPQNQRIGEGVYIHTCYKVENNKRVPDRDAYIKCQVCPIFGIPGEFAVMPSRLLVRDATLDETSAEALEKARTDLPYTEVKWEAAIDRVTAAATPRQMERVPAGAVFNMEMVYNIHEEPDLGRFSRLLEALQLLEDDYLGGLGSRGSGKVAFQNLKLTARHRERYQEHKVYMDKEFGTLEELLAPVKGVQAWLREKFPLS